MVPVAARARVGGDCQPGTARVPANGVDASSRAAQGRKRQAVHVASLRLFSASAFAFATSLLANAALGLATGTGNPAKPANGRVLAALAVGEADK